VLVEQGAQGTRVQDVAGREPVPLDDLERQLHGLAAREVDLQPIRSPGHALQAQHLDRAGG